MHKEDDANKSIDVFRQEKWKDAAAVATTIHLSTLFLIGSIQETCNVKNIGIKPIQIHNREIEYKQKGIGT